MIDLSIAVVSYYNYADVERLTETIERYTPRNISKQMYIIDNAGEEEKYRALQKKYSGIVYMNAGENVGFGKGHNLALGRCSSRYHAIVNPDILLVEDSFSKILEYMEKNRDVGMCVPRLVDEQGNLQHVYRKEVTVADMFIRMFARRLFPARAAEHELQNADYSRPFQVPFAQGSFLVARTEFLKKLQGFDQRYFMYMEDADLCHRVNQVSRLMYVPDTKVVHKWEKGSHKNIRLFGKHVASMVKYFQKWGVKLY